MEVKLAGFNVPADILGNLACLREEAKWFLSNRKNKDIFISDLVNNLDAIITGFTPEVITAAYARISRDPKSIIELREEAEKEIAKARKSNTSIYYKFGHHSIAEHAALNFDIVGISRLSVENFQRHRLDSFTEKSQRFIKLKKDFVIPEELEGRYRDRFIESINFQNQKYHEVFPILANIVGKSRAKEDARYLTSLATESQFGMTLNARSLEKLIREFLCDPKKEIRDAGEKLYREADKIIPSLIFCCKDKNFYRYWEDLAKEIEKKDPKEAAELRELKYENQNFEKTPGHLRKIVKEAFENSHIEKNSNFFKEGVFLVDSTAWPDVKIAAALLHKNSTKDYSECLCLAHEMRAQCKLGDFFKESLRYLSRYDAVPREFEVADFSFMLPISAAGYGQLKRHRIGLTLLKQDYNPELGITIPDSFKQAHIENIITEVQEKTEMTYYPLKEKYGVPIASYSLMQAHNAYVLFVMNEREVYAFSRLREDPTAQWDIRSKAHEISGLVKEVAPYSTFLLGGRTGFDETRQSFYGKEK